MDTGDLGQAIPFYDPILSRHRGRSWWRGRRLDLGLRPVRRGGHRRTADRRGGDGLWRIGVDGPTSVARLWFRAGDLFGAVLAPLDQQPAEEEDLGCEKDKYGQAQVVLGFRSRLSERRARWNDWVGRSHKSRSPSASQKLRQGRVHIPSSVAIGMPGRTSRRRADLPGRKDGSSTPGATTARESLGAGRRPVRRTPPCPAGAGPALISVVVQVLHGSKRGSAAWCSRFAALAKPLGWRATTPATIKFLAWWQVPLAACTP
jgi:hypothetical protein